MLKRRPPSLFFFCVWNSFEKDVPADILKSSKGIHQRAALMLHCCCWYGTDALHKSGFCTCMVPAPSVGNRVCILRRLLRKIGGRFSVYLFFKRRCISAGQLATRLKTAIIGEKI